LNVCLSVRLSFFFILLIFLWFLHKLA
jgi:hypothetical protein